MLKRNLGIIGLVFLAIPLPGNLDLRLINELQFAATDIASRGLDSVGIPHFKEGVTLVTAKDRFFAEEACSGIRSLFSTISAMAIYTVFFRHGFLRLLLNLVQSFFWVVLGNGLRIAIVIVFAENGVPEMASGTPHYLLGLGIFGLIVGLTVCTDFFTAGLIGWRRPKTNEILGKKGKGDYGKLVQLNWGYGLLFFFAFFVSAKLVYAKEAHVWKSNYKQSFYAKVAESWIPSNIGNFQVVSFEHEIRRSNHPVSPESFKWHLTDKAGIIDNPVFSIDGPYPELHELHNCYRSLGWKIERLQYQGAPKNSCLIQMRDNGRFGYVLYTAFGNHGRMVTPFQMVDRLADFKNNVEQVFGLTFITKSNWVYDLPVSQVQFFFQSNRQLTDEEIEPVINQFEKMKGFVLKNVR